MNTYTLKTGLKCSILIRAIDKCRGKVLLKTARGDVLDLKSDLSRFVFVSAFANANLMFDAALELSEPSDYVYIAECVISASG